MPTPVLPKVPLRQYVLAMPHDLHHRLARDAALESQTLAIFLEELSGHLRATSDATGEPGFVTFIQRFGSSVNLHVHFHVLALDGVYVRASDGTLRFQRAQTPTREQLEALVSFTARRVRSLTGPSDSDEVPAVVAPMFKVLGLAPDETPPAAKPFTAEVDGFNLHAATRFEADDREAVERFCRYAGRGPLALARLALAPNGNVVYRLKHPRPDGTTHVVFTPQSFLTRLSWLVVQPGVHLTRYHGVFAPHHSWRSEIVPRAPVDEHGDGPSRASWSSLLRRVFAVDVLICAVCGGKRRVIAEIEEGPVARKILEHLGLPTSAPRPGQGGLFPTGPPAVDEPEASVAWSDADYDQRLTESETFA